jgi:hypothetical protein
MQVDLPAIAIEMVLPLWHDPGSLVRLAGQFNLVTLDVSSERLGNVLFEKLSGNK